jgi:hypothetical protein
LLADFQQKVAACQWHVGLYKMKHYILKQTENAYKIYAVQIQARTQWIILNSECI